MSAACKQTLDAVTACLNRGVGFRVACRPAKAPALGAPWAFKSSCGRGEARSALKSARRLENHRVAEEKPGLLKKVLDGLTSLHLRASALDCSDIASPNLRCLAIMLDDRLRRLQGANSSILRSQTERSLRPLTGDRVLWERMQWATVPSCGVCATAYSTQQRRISGST